MVSTVALIVGPVLAGFVLIGALLMNPSLGEAYFAAIWWGMTVIVAVICAGFLQWGMGGSSTEEGAAGPQAGRPDARLIEPRPDLQSAPHP